MDPYVRVPQTTARHRRTERNADAYPGAAIDSRLTGDHRPDGQHPSEPSMQAPQPMPTAGIAHGTPSSPANPPVRQAAPASASPSAPQRPIQPSMPQRPASQPLVSSQPLIPQQNAMRLQEPVMPAYPAQNPSQSPPMRPQNLQQSQPIQPQGFATPFQAQQPYSAQPNAAPKPQQMPYPSAANAWASVPPQQGAYQNQQTPWQRPYSQQPPPPVQHSPTGKRSGGEPPKRWLPWLALILVLVLVGVGVSSATIASRNAAQANQLREFVTAYDDLFCQGVYVDGIHLGGMTRQQAYDAVANQAQYLRDQWHVQLTYMGDLVRLVNADDLGMSINVDSALAAAWQQGHTGTSYEARKAEMDALILEPYEGFTSLPSGNTAAIDEILQELASQVQRSAVDAELLQFDPLLTYPFTIRESVTGRMLNIGPTKERLYDMAETMESGSIAMELLEIQPNVTTDALKSQLTLRGSAYTEISTQSTQNRTNNIRRAFELISGKVLKPGESFSFNGIVGPRTAKNGFFEAIEYAYNQERMGYGGGVCQASSTIYIAAVRANLDIVKREPHSDKVNYTEYGLDATVNLDGKKIDLVFKNNTNHNIYIKSSVQRDHKISRDHYLAVVEIWGEALGDGVTYDLVAETREIIPAPVDPEYHEDKDGEYVTYIDEEYVYRQAKEGYVVDSFKVTYLNGEEVDRTLLYEDTYKPKTKYIYTGIKEREAGWIAN